MILPEMSVGYSEIIRNIYVRIPEKVSRIHHTGMEFSLTPE